MASKIDGANFGIEADPATWTALEEKIFIWLMVKEVPNGKGRS